MPEKRFDTYIKISGTDEHGVVYGYAMVSKKDGEDYYDSQGDNIPEASLISASLDFMKNSRAVKDSHAGPDCGIVPFAFPLTETISKSLGLTSAEQKYGLLVGLQLDNPEMVSKFKDGTYTGFSIGGVRIEDEIVEKIEKASHPDDEKLKKPKKRKMKKFRIDEISIVGRPAQADALATIVKGDHKIPFLKRKEGGDHPAFGKRARLLTDVDGHSHLIWDDEEALGGGRTSFDASGEKDSDGFLITHSHPWAKDSMGNISIGESDGHTHEVVVSKDTASGGEPGNKEAGMPKDAEQAAQMKKQADEIEELKKGNAVLQTVASFSTVEKAHYDSLSDEDKKGFVSKSEDQRQTILKELQEADTIVYKSKSDGNVYRKSDGEKAISMAKRLDEQAEVLEKVKAEADQIKYIKMVDEEIPHLKGTVEQRIAMYKAAEVLGTEHVEILKSASATLAGNFETLGTVGGTNVPSYTKGTESDPMQKINKMAEEHIEKNPEVTKAAAVAHVVSKTEKGKELYAQTVAEMRQ